MTNACKSLVYEQTNSHLGENQVLKRLPVRLPVKMADDDVIGLSLAYDDEPAAVPILSSRLSTCMLSTRNYVVQPYHCFLTSCS